MVMRKRGTIRKEEEREVLPLNADKNKETEKSP